MNNRFLKMIQQLWKHEEVILYGHVLHISPTEMQEVGHFLKKAYAREALDYPHQPAPFNQEAANWAARTIYLAAQLLLYREHKVDDLPALFTPFSGTLNSSAILSADLCLRFLPEICKELKLIDPDDELIPLLEDFLQTWHYTAVNYPLPIEALNFDAIVEDACLHQLYANRIIQYKNQPLAQLESMAPLVNANLGNYKNEFWAALNDAS